MRWKCWKILVFSDGKSMFVEVDTPTVQPQLPLDQQLPQPELLHCGVVYLSIING